MLRASNSLRYQSPNMGGFTVRGMYSFGEAAGSSVASVTVPMGMAGQWLLSYGAYHGQARAQSDARALSVRYDHSLSKRTKLYAGVGRIHNEAGAAFTINTASNAGPVVQAGSRPSSVVLGISHAF